VLGILIIAITRSQPTPNLNAEEFKTRFAMVTLAELLAFGIFSLPYVWKDNRNAPWGRACMRIGGLTAAAVSLIIISFFTVSQVLLTDQSIKVSTEYFIVVIYILNTLGLSASITRTGGPAKSLYANLLPIQLAGFLLLELQKELLISQKGSPSVSNHLIYLFAGLTLAAWIVTHWFRAKDPSLPDFSDWITYVSALGILLTTVGYFLPRQKWFVDLISGSLKKG
jgi:hypothetical protein